MMLRFCTTRLAPTLPSGPGIITRSTQTYRAKLSCVPSEPFFTSQTLLTKTRKRRKSYPFFWLQDKYRAYYDENLTPENEQFFQQFLREKYSLDNGASPLKKEPWDVNEAYDAQTTARTGVVARKLGIVPQWTKAGRRVSTTVLMVSDNHVIKYHSPEECVEFGSSVDQVRYQGIRPNGVGSYVNLQSRRHAHSSVGPSATSYESNVNVIEDNLELNIKSSENETYVEAVPVSTGREGKVIQTPATQACALCRLNLTNLHYTDVLILDQFIKRNGSLVTFHESKLCPKQYRKITRLIEMAQRCNLIRRPADYLVPGPWHDLNTYLEPDRKRDQPMKVIKKEYWKI